MNICIVYSAKFSQTRGGVENVCYNLATELRKIDGIQLFHIYQTHDNEPDIPGIRYLEIPFISKEHDLEYNLTLNLVRDYIKRNDIDIIWLHTQTLSLTHFIAKARIGTSAKIVYVLHNNPSLFFGELNDRYSLAYHNFIFHGHYYPLVKHIIQYPLARINAQRRSRIYLTELFQISDYFVLLSDSFKSEFYKLSKLSHTKKLRCISNPLLPTEASAPQGNRKNQLLVVSRHVWKQKRLDRIIRIWSKIQHDFPEWQLVILGDGPNHDDYVQIARKLKTKRIMFAGQKNPIPYYKSSKILCMSSSWEGFGLVLTEAQQYGCVPIAYKSYAALDDIIIDGKTGYSVTAFNEREYIRKLTMLMMNEEKRTLMAAEAKKHVQKFYIKNIAQKWIDLFNEVINDSSDL